jgi:hypothetical protein
MPSQSETRPEGRTEVNLKTHFAPNSNTAKKPEDSSDDPMTVAQASHPKALSEECGEPDWRQSGSTRSRQSEGLRNNGHSLFGDAPALPDRPISPHRNFVTEAGLAAIEVALGRFEAAHRDALAKDDRSAAAAASRELPIVGRGARAQKS